MLRERRSKLHRQIKMRFGSPIVDALGLHPTLGQHIPDDRAAASNCRVLRIYGSVMSSKADAAVSASWCPETGSDHNRTARGGSGQRYSVASSLKLSSVKPDRFSLPGQQMPPPIGASRRSVPNPRQEFRGNTQARTKVPVSEQEVLPRRRPQPDPARHKHPQHIVVRKQSDRRPLAYAIDETRSTRRTYLPGDSPPGHPSREDQPAGRPRGIAWASSSYSPYSFDEVQVHTALLPRPPNRSFTCALQWADEKRVRTPPWRARGVASRDRRPLSVKVYRCAGMLAAQAPRSPCLI